MTFETSWYKGALVVRQRTFASSLSWSQALLAFGVFVAAVLIVGMRNPPSGQINFGAVLAVVLLSVSGFFAIWTPDITTMVVDNGTRVLLNTRWLHRSTNVESWEAEDVADFVVKASPDQESTVLELWMQLKDGQVRHLGSCYEGERIRNAAKLLRSAIARL
jgi:hypothetical protein